MNPKDSSLYDLTLQAIQSGQFDETGTKELIEYVSQSYIYWLRSQGQTLPRESIAGLKVEIGDSVKAITYGSYSIKDYNQKRRKI